MPRKKTTANGKEQNGNGANLGFEQTLWAAADKMRGHMDAAECKHVALGLMFLKYISDAFQELYDDLERRADTDYTDPEDRDEYMAENVFWVPEEARWSYIRDSATQPAIGKIIDEAMLAIEKENPKRLKGVLPTGYARPDLDKTRLGELINLISKIGLGDEASLSSWVYEYFLKHKYPSLNFTKRISAKLKNQLSYSYNLEQAKTMNQKHTAFKYQNDDQIQPSSFHGYWQDK